MATKKPTVPAGPSSFGVTHVSHASPAGRSAASPRRFVGILAIVMAGTALLRGVVGGSPLDPFSAEAPHRDPAQDLIAGKVQVQGRALDDAALEGGRVHVNQRHFLVGFELELIAAAVV